jgi:exodeoxyribonuclease-5
MQLSDEQGRAVAAVVRWFKGKQQVFELSGPAGTGKTTLAKYITEELGLTGSEVLYCAFTGKAALVLSQKGCSPSSTVHSAIYKSHQNEQTGKWSFQLGYDALKELGVKLVVLDEAPMLGKEVAEDLISCGVKVLALGDKWQLPPVNSEAYFGVREPDNGDSQTSRRQPHYCTSYAGAKWRNPKGGELRRQQSYQG